MGQKLEGSADLLGRGSWVSIYHKFARAKAYLHTKWHLNPSSYLATTDMGQKLGLCPFGGGEAGSPFNTMFPGPRPTCMPSFISIHPTVWPQYTNVTDRQDRTGQTYTQDNGSIANGEPFRKRWPKKPQCDGAKNRTFRSSLCTVKSGDGVFETSTCMRSVHMQQFKLAYLLTYVLMSGGGCKREREREKQVRVTQAGMR